MRYAYETPRWIAINHPDFGWIVVEDVTLYATPWEVIVADTEAELREAMGDKWPEQQ